MGIPVEGKSIFPICGELDPSIVRDSAISAGLLPASAAIEVKALVDAPALPMRPPLLCPGCPHRGIFAITNKLELVVNGDIGCYTLGFLPPLSALHTCGCMGASIGVAHGVSKAGIRQKNVAVIGDSTFFHTGMPALLNVAYNNSNTVTIIVDNRTTAMTGHQDHPGTGRTLQGQPTFTVRFEDMARAMGIEHVYTVDPYDLEQVETALRICLEAEAPAVVISQRACALLPEVRRQWLAIELDSDLCVGCGLCFDIGCPALVEAYHLNPKHDHRPQRPWIDPLLCTGCEICAQVCEHRAILFHEGVRES
jgi:indolepyruvate ferredoxin oxidoreductase alpha subunit